MNAKKEILRFLIIIAAGAAIAVILNLFVIINANVTSESMMPALQKDDRLIGLKLAYVFGSPKRGDIIIFRYPDDESVLLVKRVIGLPGEMLEIKDGKVYINGTDIPLDEPYVTQEVKGNYGPCLIPAKSYFVMGDNRDNSKDSRLWSNTYVREGAIVAKAFFRYYKSFGIIR